MIAMSTDRADPSDAWGKVSVIVPVFNSQRDLELFIAFIERCDYPQIEVVVVDDASIIPIALPPTKLTVRIVRNSTNCGKAYSVNRGAQLATGKFLVVSDPDVEPAIDLFRRWVLAFEADERLGIVGAYVYYDRDRNRLTHAGALVTGPLHFVVRQLVDRIDDGFSKKEVRSRNLALDDIYAVRSELWARAGGLDDDNFDTMYEDVDFQMRLAGLGCDIAVVSNARAYHRQDLDVSVAFSMTWANRVMHGFKLSALPRNRLIFLRKHRLARGWVLWLQAVLLIAFYGSYAVLAGASCRSRLAQGVQVLQAVTEGMKRPISRVHSGSQVV